MMVTPAESLRSFGDRYRLLKLVGEGSSARVYVAEDLTLHRRVALKILKVEIADDTSFRDRFAAEMRATSLLNHPRVLPVYDWGLDPQPYSVTEYLTGGSLAMLLAAGHRLTPSQALVMGLEAARALVNIHAGGRAHLSLGPSAILFDSGARPYISDLGLSAALLPVAAGDGDGATTTLLRNPRTSRRPPARRRTVTPMTTAPDRQPSRRRARTSKQLPLRATRRWNRTRMCTTWRCSSARP